MVGVHLDSVLLLGAICVGAVVMIVLLVLVFTVFVPWRIRGGSE
jgi:hypothetical protein